MIGIMTEHPGNIDIIIWLMPVWIILISQGDASLDSGYQSRLDRVTAGGPSRHTRTRCSTPDVSPKSNTDASPWRWVNPKKRHRLQEKQTKARRAAHVVFPLLSFLNTGTVVCWRISDTQDHKSKRLNQDLLLYRIPEILNKNSSQSIYYWVSSLIGTLKDQIWTQQIGSKHTNHQVVLTRGRSERRNIHCKHTKLPLLLLFPLTTSTNVRKGHTLSHRTYLC